MTFQPTQTSQATSQTLSEERPRALVTGAAGFLGSHLCDRLIQSGYSVIGVDNLYTGSLKNLRTAMSTPYFQFLEWDICNPIPAGELGQIQWIYNLACPASPPHYQKDPIFTTLTNVMGTYHLLKLAQSKSCKFFQASTSEVYGDPEVHPQVEIYRGNVNPVGIRSCYDEGKRCAESLVFDFHRSHGVDIRVARIFNTYGPRMDPMDGRVISNFIVQALKGQDLTLYGDGTQTRSFCYVDDLISGFIALTLNNTQVKGPVNLGNPVEFTVAEVAQLILNKTQSHGKLVFQKLPSDDPLKRKPDISLAQNSLGWNPEVPLLHGIDKTISYFRELLLTEEKPSVAVEGGLT